jgi:hypothetical protein
MDGMIDVRRLVNVVASVMPVPLRISSNRLSASFEASKFR